MACSPAGRENGSPYEVHAPPSIRYSVRATPLPASEAETTNELRVVYGPEAGRTSVAGGVSSTTTSTLPVATLPRRSDARYSSTLVRSGPDNEIAPAYGVHAPPFRRYSTRATPTGSAPSSVAASVIGVRDVTYTFAPPERGSPISRVAVGALPSTITANALEFSTFPRR